jgi:hypothetical protein
LWQTGNTADMSEVQMSNEYAEAYKARKQEDRIGPALEAAKKASTPTEVKKPTIREDDIEKAFQKSSIPAAEQLAERQ